LQEYEIFPVFKDFYYFLSPIFGIIVGQYLAYRRRPQDLIVAIKVCGIISALIMIVSAAVNTGVDGFINPREAREEEIIGANSCVLLACAILWYNILYESRLKRVRTWCLFFVTLLGVYISGSRTLWVSEIIFLAIVGWKFYKEHIFRTIAIASFCAVGAMTLIVANPKNSMVKMILHSSEEMTITKSYTRKQMVHNYRGYESAMALKYYSTFPIEEKLVGRGFGTAIDVQTKNLVGLRYVPITHNGYPYILVKSGLLGLAMFIWWGLITIRSCVRLNVRQLAYGYLYKFLGIAVVFMVFVTNSTVTTYVNAFYNSSLMLIGALLYYTYPPVRCKYQL